jgi:uncharacterized protein YcbK (DUF882 family)
MLPDGRHFTAAEFACHDGTPYPEAWRDRWIALRDLCDAIRDLWGGPLIVVSGFRTVAHNQELIDDDTKKGSHGVASGSMHIIGSAADLRTTHGPADAPQLLRVILTAYEDKKLPLLGGAALYPESNWVHVDTFRATDGHLRRWSGR